VLTSAEIILPRGVEFTSVENQPSGKISYRTVLLLTIADVIVSLKLSVHNMCVFKHKQFRGSGITQIVIAKHKIQYFALKQRSQPPNKTTAPNTLFH